MTTSKRILLVDDNTSSLDVLSKCLISLGYEVVSHSKMSALDLANISPDIIITNQKLPQCIGIDTCKFFQNKENLYYVIIMTNHGDIDLLSSAFHRGVNNFIKKPINYNEVKIRLENASQLLDLINDNFLQKNNILEYVKSLEQETENLYIELMKDSLTGLYNRRYAETVLSRDWKNTNRVDQKLCIISVDLDKFKDINDTYGHPVGDEVLKHVAGIMTTCIRENDTICRMGGEEFIIITIDSTIYGIHAICEKIRQSIESCQPDHLKLEKKVTVSIGAAVMDSKLDSSWNDTYSRSDMAMYTAKKSGRNCYVIYGENNFCIFQ